MSGVGQTFAMLAELPLQIASCSIEPLSRQLAAQSIRHTTVVHLLGGDQEGVGEDITPTKGEYPTPALTGDWTIESFAAHIATLELFPTPPPHPTLRPFRRWALESAALDLALRQAGRSLEDALARPARPLTFVNSLQLPDPPTAAPVRERLEQFPDLRFKLDPKAGWDHELIAELAATGAVDTLDLKGQYPPQASLAQPPDPQLYEHVVRALPDAWIEDPAITPETWKVLEPHRERITWDAPLQSLADVRRLSTRGRTINVKPVRFGSLRALLDVYDHCIGNGIGMYGGGFDDLGL